MLRSEEGQAAARRRRKGKVIRAQLTKIWNVLGFLSKSFEMVDGELSKGPKAQLTSGVATREEVDDLPGLADLISKLGKEHALTFGVPDQKRTRITTQKRLSRTYGASCRDHAHFKWPAGRGVFMLDVDRPKDGAKAFKAREFDEMLCGLLPWWGEVARMYLPSASAFIYKDTGEELSGAGSLRCYAIADKAKNIPYLGVMIADAFWRGGQGRIEFNAVGARMVRCPIDCSVWQPERLDFAGQVILGPGLVKKKFPPLILEGRDIDTEVALSDFGKRSFSKWSASSPDVCSVYRAARPESVKRQKEVMRKRIETDVEKGECPIQARQKWKRAIEDGVLSGSYVLHFLERGGRIDATVDEVMANPQRYLGLRLSDPEEPNYGNDRRIALLYESGVNLHIYSHAHGGKHYRLLRSKR